MRKHQTAKFLSKALHIPAVLAKWSPEAGTVRDVVQCTLVQYE